MYCLQNADPKWLLAITFLHGQLAEGVTVSILPLCTHTASIFHSLSRLLQRLLQMTSACQARVPYHPGTGEVNKTGGARASDGRHYENILQFRTGEEASVSDSTLSVWMGRENQNQGGGISGVFTFQGSAHTWLKEKIKEIMTSRRRQRTRKWPDFRNNFFEWCRVLSSPAG